MSRTGAEEKPEWRRVPRPVRAGVADMLGAPVVRARRIWGGYGPSATFRISLQDGRRAFFKGVYPHPNTFMHRALAGEERVYRGIGVLLEPWAPAFFGSLRLEGWHALLLEDLGPASVPPWTTARARAAARSFGEFHRSTLGRPLPRWLPRRRMWTRFGQHWEALTQEPDGFAGTASLAAGREREARRWLTAAVPVLREASTAFTRVRAPYALLHFDTRSDNLRIHDGQLRLFDWPYACVGPAEFDAAAFAQSVPYETAGPPAEQIMAWYGERVSVRQTVVDYSVAAIAGYFAAQAWLPQPPGLPRLRSIQRRQFCTSLAWAARRLNLPEPEWLAAIAP